jgi:hypothetical protein
MVMVLEPAGPVWACACGEDRIPGFLARHAAGLVVLVVVVMFLTACAIAVAMWVLAWWQRRGEEPDPAGEAADEESFFGWFGQAEEARAPAEGPPMVRREDPAR